MLNNAHFMLILKKRNLQNYLDYSTWISRLLGMKVAIYKKKINCCYVSKDLQGDLFLEIRRNNNFTPLSC